MTKAFVAPGGITLALALSLAACTNPYDPGQRALGGGLIGAGAGAAIGAAAGGGTGAATTRHHHRHLDTEWAGPPDPLVVAKRGLSHRPGMVLASGR